MVSSYEAVRNDLQATPRRWLVTGGAGFIGSHLVEHLLSLGQNVVVLDNFSTGHRRNLDHVTRSVRARAAARLTVVEGDIRNADACRKAAAEVSCILHQAALGSVPRSIETPLATHEVNVTGTLNVFEAARALGVKRVVYASSSSVYGDHPDLPKVEARTGRQLSPYAASKFCDETYAHAFTNCYGLELVGLRYFNVFGPRQDPQGPYAAVMPRWFSALLKDAPVQIYGDGETSRDFCYVANVVQANLLAAMTVNPDALNQAYNVALGDRTTLNELFALIREQVARYRPAASRANPEYCPFRAGDIRHSLADIGKARKLLGYDPTHTIRDGLGEAAAWYATAAT